MSQPGDPLISVEEARRLLIGYDVQMPTHAIRMARTIIDLSERLQALQESLRPAWEILEALNISVKWELAEAVKVAISDALPAVRLALQRVEWDEEYEQLLREMRADEPCLNALLDAEDRGWGDSKEEVATLEELKTEGDSKP